MGRPLLVIVAALLCLAVVQPVGAAEPLYHWAFGWDPVDSGTGLTLRYRPSPVWDLGVSAGPNDYRTETESVRWDSDTILVDDGVPDNEDRRREQGWVRLAGARRFWNEDRVAVSAVCGVTYRWSVEEQRYRNQDQLSGGAWDFRNSRDHDDIRTWTVAVGMRPSVAITPRLQVEFEGGVRFTRTTIEHDYDQWWDSSSNTIHEDETRHDRNLDTYGGFEFYRLKFLFWF